MEEKICLVCSVPITFTRLGLEVCRACASFFIRTTLAGRSYTCRKDDGKCTFRKHEEFMCQSCRYDRCLQLGIVYVEPRKRRPRRKKAVEEDTLPTRDRRLVRERQYAAVNDLQLMDHPSAEIYVMYFTDFYEILRITVSESRRVVEEAFDAYGCLSTHDKATVFKNFFGKFRFLEIFYLSSQYFGEDSNYMTSLITCVDTNNVEGWVTIKDAVERKDELRSSLQGFAEEYLLLINQMLRMDKLTEREFHALLVFAFLDNVIDLPLSEETFDNFEKSRLKVLEEMRDYYVNEMRLLDFSERLGNLFIVAHGAGEAGIIFYKEMRIYNTIFEFYADDQLIREALLN